MWRVKLWSFSKTTAFVAVRGTKLPDNQWLTEGTSKLNFSDLEHRWMACYDRYEYYKLIQILILFETTISNNSQASCEYSKIPSNCYRQCQYTLIRIITGDNWESRFESKIYGTLLTWGCPVERIFGKLKSKLRSMGGSMTINFNKLKGAELIFKLINSIDTSSWYKAWKVVIIEARKSIAEILVKKSISNELNWRDNQIALGLLSLDNTKDADKTSSI